MPLSLFNMAFALAALNKNRALSGVTKTADSVVAGLLPNGLGLAFPLIVNAQNPSPAPAADGNGNIDTLTRVPNVVGNCFADASAALQNAGLGEPIEQRAFDYDPKDKKGHVVQQDPGANSFAPLGASVTLVVSDGAYQQDAGQTVMVSADMMRQFEAVEQHLLNRLSNAVTQHLNASEPALLEKIEQTIDKKLANAKLGPK